MATHRTTFSRRPDPLAPPEVIGAADFDTLDAARAAGRQWLQQDPLRHGYEVEQMPSSAGRPTTSTDFAL